MNLEELNKEYLEQKADLKKANNDKNALEAKLNNLLDDKTIQQGKLVEAKRNKDDTARQNAESEIERIEKEIEQVKEAAQNKLDDAKELQSKIDDKIRQIQADPEMKKHLSEVLAKKYDRKLSKIEKEKEELTGKKERFENLQKLVTDHPSLGNNLKGVLGAQKEIDDLEAELKSLIYSTIPGQLINYKNPTRANEIMTKLLPEAEKRLTTNKTTLMSYIIKNNLGITEQDINELATKGFVVDSKGNMDLNGTINKSISGLNRQIKGCNKSIRDHQIALEKYSKEGPALEPTPAPAPEPTPEPEVKKEKFLQKMFNWGKNVIKFFKGEDIKALPEPTPAPTPAPEPIPAKENAFKDSLKYDIVKDIVSQMEKDERKQAKTERKAENEGR